MRSDQIILSISLFLIFGCHKETNNIQEYFHLTDQAEIFICQKNFTSAISSYDSAFENIEKPIGKDVFNAALCAGLVDNSQKLESYLQLIVDNCDDLTMIYHSFVDRFITNDEWKALVDNKQLDYDFDLRKEMHEMYILDQKFRPMYDTHDDTIKQNLLINMDRLIELSETNGFPAMYELGYQPDMREQDHHIVLYHHSQRRSKDKTIQDLTPLLRKLVDQGRLDPESAILYLKFQNDPGQGPFETYASEQYMHPLLPDSLNNNIWRKELNGETLNQINQIRSDWYASSIENIIKKATFLEKSKHPFIFTSVRKSKANLAGDMDSTQALITYNFLIKDKIRLN